ncbi:MAG: hypothetical protein GYB68_04275 [Chloroflexi bacterium]|nr:hypothetical protein [Chloroflexota bacterium]
MELVHYIAEPYIAGSPDAMVNGRIVLGLSRNPRIEAVIPLLPKHCLDHAREDFWYPHQALLNLLYDVEQELGEAAWEVFVAFGQAAFEQSNLPTIGKDVPSALRALHAIHHALLRNVPAGEGFIVEGQGPGDMLVLNNTPYPDAAVYGYLWGLVNRYCPIQLMFRVRVIDNPDPQRALSAFNVSWGRDLH